MDSVKDGFFFEGLNILISAVCVCADGLKKKGLSKAFHYFSLIGRCSLMPTSHWLQGKCARINLPQEASGMIL